MTHRLGNGFSLSFTRSFPAPTYLPPCLSRVPVTTSSLHPLAIPSRIFLMASIPIYLYDSLITTRNSSSLRVLFFFFIFFLSNSKSRLFTFILFLSFVNMGGVVRISLSLSRSTLFHIVCITTSFYLCFIFSP